MTAELSVPLDDGGRNDLRVQPIHVRTMGVERIKEVIEQRAKMIRQFGVRVKERCD